MEANVSYREGVSFEIEVWRHRLVVDLPADKGEAIWDPCRRNYS
jgi:hypothetical protein